MKKIVLTALICSGLVAVMLLVSQANAQDEPQPTPDPRFGAIESFWAPEEAAELNVGFERILFYWNEIQPTDADDWNTLHVLEEWLVEANEEDRIVLGLLKNTPQWATDGQPFSGVPRGLYLPIDDPDNLWAAYVGKVIDYYAPRGVHHWIIWNEPEIEFEVYGHEFSGTTEDYYQLLKVASQVAKERDPEAVIHLAGWSYWHDPEYLDEFLTVATADPEGEANGYFFDTLSLHIYFRIDTVKGIVEIVDRIQNSYGIDKPIWINETNSSPNLDPGWPVERPNFQVDLEQQAWYIVQAYALGFGAGADSIAVYKLIDILLPEGGESFGILRPNHEKRPGFFAYRTVIEQLSGFDSAEIQENDQMTSVLFTKPDELVRVIWARRERALEVKLPAFGDSAVLVDPYGNETPISAEDGSYIINLDGARCRGECLEGGPPFFLVEPGAERPERLPNLQPALNVFLLTPTPEVTLTYTPQPSPTATATATPSPTSTPTATPTETPTPTATPTLVATATSMPTATPEAAATISAETPPESSNELGWLGPTLMLIGAGVAAISAVVVVARRRK